MRLISIFFMISFLFTVNGKAQIGQIETVREGKVIGVANERGFPKLVKKGEHYLLSYYNENLRELEAIDFLTFHATEEELEKLHRLFKEQFSRSDERTVTVGEDRIYVESQYGQRLVIRVSHQDGTSSRFYIYPEELDPLFGKS